jgi:DNA-directed RNA polymerase specialized sigma24 family protein
MTIYQRLRSIGCTVETSDAIEPILGSMSMKKREAFFLWACGMSEEEAGKECGMSHMTVSRIIVKVRNNMFKIMIKSDIYSEGQ